MKLKMKDGFLTTDLRIKYEVSKTNFGIDTFRYPISIPFPGISTFRYQFRNRYFSITHCATDFRYRYIFRYQGIDTRYRSQRYMTSLMYTQLHLFLPESIQIHTSNYEKILAIDTKLSFYQNSNIGHPGVGAI